MAISFQLNLTPNQIEFLQALDLYADGIADVPDERMFITWAGKLRRQGLIEHVVPKAGERYEGQCPSRGTIVIKAYRITEKGRSVLAMIEHDVKAFLSRQKEYQKAKKTKRRTA